MAGMLQRLFTGLRTVCAVSLLTVATFAAAQGVRGDHPDTYVVVRGDTLWGIAGRFLERPWLWPEIWQANPQIQNPHLIYPGDVISLAYLNRVDQPAQARIIPGPRQDAEPINAIALSDIEPFLKDLRVVDSFDHLPHVVGVEEDRMRGAESQLVYARGIASARPGDRFTLVRPTVRYHRLAGSSRFCCDQFSAADLDFRGNSLLDSRLFWTSVVTPGNGKEVLGYELKRVGSGTVTRSEVGGIQASTLLLDEDGLEVRTGDRLIAVDVQPYDLQFFPHPPAQQTDYGHARVLAVADMLTSGGPRDVIAISVGAREGVDNGTVFSIWREGTNTVDRVRQGEYRDPGTVTFGNKVRLPDEFAGHAMVFRTYDRVSYAMVMDSVRPTRVGYHLKHPDAPY